MHFTTSCFALFFHLTNGVIFPGFGKISQPHISLGCLESVANKKGVYLEKNSSL